MIHVYGKCRPMQNMHGLSRPGPPHPPCTTMNQQCPSKKCLVGSGDSWMYPYQRTPMGNPYKSPKLGKTYSKPTTASGMIRDLFDVPINRNPIDPYKKTTVFRETHDPLPYDIDIEGRL